MSQPCPMKQLGARSMGCIVECMQWSNKMDLLAYGNDKGEVIVQRLNFHKIVSFASPGESVKVRTLAWQLDETMLAAGYSNGQVKFLDVERESVIFSIEFNEDIKKLHFSRVLDIQDYRCPLNNVKQFTHKDFLLPLPPLNGICSATHENETHKSFTTCASCFLIVTLVSGQMHMLLYGALRAGSIHLQQHVSNPDDFEVHDICLSGDYDTLLVSLRDGTELKVLRFTNEILKEYMSPLMQLAENCANIYETKHYINETVQCISEAWESVLLEMDNKLTKYCNSQPEGSISADFLDILLFGYTPRSIMHFLMEELTERGVKKLASSIELSFTTIKNLISKSLICAVTNMFYFLNSVLGMARFQFFFQELLSEEAAEEAQRFCGAFILKTQELHQIIEGCSNDMKLLFNWLQIVIARFHMQELPEDMKQLSEQDYRYLAEYLYSFEDSVIKHADGTVTKRKFNLEKIGQYFEDKELQQKAKRHPDKFWHRLLKENECLRNSKLLYPYNADLSLIQQRNKLFESIEILLRRSGENINASFTLQTQIVCCTLPAEINFQRSGFISAASGDLLAMLVRADELLLLEFDISFQRVTSTCVTLRAPAYVAAEHSLSALEHLRYIDIQFYNCTTLSVLAQGTPMASSSTAQSQSIFLQLHLDKAEVRSSVNEIRTYMQLNELLSDKNSVHELLDFGAITYKNLENVCNALAVTGSRKVVSLLCDQRRRLLIFEMEVEDDDDETTEISHNSMLELSKGSKESSLERLNIE